MWCDVSNKMFNGEVLKILKYIEDLGLALDLGR